MVCYVCRRRAVDTCPRCGRHFCSAHGSELCRDCASPISALPANITYRAVLLASFLLAALAFAFLLVWPPIPASPPRTGLLSTQLLTASQPEPEAGAAPRAVSPSLPPTPTPAPSTPTRTPTPQPGVQYTVVQGDSLLGIALRYDVTVAALTEANNLSVTSLLGIGQVLIIPR